MEKDTSTMDTYSMCCLHCKAYTRLLIFAAPDKFAFCFFWSNMALLTFSVADPWPIPKLGDPTKGKTAVE